MGPVSLVCDPHVLFLGVKTDGSRHFETLVPPSVKHCEHSACESSIVQKNFFPHLLILAAQEESPQQRGLKTTIAK